MFLLPAYRVAGACAIFKRPWGPRHVVEGPGKIIFLRKVVFFFFLFLDTLFPDVVRRVKNGVLR